MNTLLELMLIQLSGIICTIFLSLVLSHLETKRRIKADSCKSKKLVSNADWTIEYFQVHPNSLLKYQYPKEFKLSRAIKRYKELNRLKEKRLISEKRFEKQLNKILPLIDIRGELRLLLSERPEM